MPRDPAYRAALDVLNEYRRAGETYDEFNSPHEGYAVLLEEVDELWDEIKNDRKPGSLERMREEAVQVGAMALKFIVMLDRIEGVNH